MLEFGIGLNRGLKRNSKVNQDAVRIVNKFSRMPLLILADGMGGYQGGETASRIVIETFKKMYRKKSSRTKADEYLLKAIMESHKQIIIYSKENPQFQKMGSTVVAGVIDQKNEQIQLANVGDSRAYIISHNKINQISYDHSEVAEMKRQGLLNNVEASNYKRKNVLTMSLSASRDESSIKPFLKTFSFPKDTILLFCSDGLWGPVSETLIQLAVLELKPNRAAKKLIELANLNGGPDNISVIVARRYGEWKKYKQKHSRDLDDTH